MSEESIRIINEKRVRGALLQVVEANHESGRYYILVINGEPRIRSVDLNMLRSA